MYKGKIEKLPVLEKFEKYKQVRDDRRTTILGLCQLLIYEIDQLGSDKSIFTHQLKQKANLFLGELEKNMDLYFRLNGEEKFQQADLLNLLCNCLEHNIKLAFRTAEMNEETCDMFLRDYDELMERYGIQNNFLNQEENESN